jgi:phosphonate transport system ATP-binding protein
VEPRILSSPGDPALPRPDARGGRRVGPSAGARAQGAAAFRLEGVTVRYPDGAALEEVDLEVSPGEVLALVGPSGAGKTTLLKLLSGSIAPSSGRVRVDGEALDGLGTRALRRVRARIGHIPQDFGLVPNLRVSQNVLAGALGRSGFWTSLRTMLFPDRAALERVYELLGDLGIPEKIFERVDALSGGQQQRAAVARALFQEPAALLADEPLSALDPARSRETLELLVDVARAHQLTLVLSLHDIELARELLPRLVGLRRGRVVWDRPPQSLAEADIQALYALEPRAATSAERPSSDAHDGPAR